MIPWYSESVDPEARPDPLFVGAACLNLPGRGGDRAGADNKALDEVGGSPRKGFK